MKTKALLLGWAASAAILVAAEARAGETPRQRVSVALRMPLSVDARFTGTLPVPSGGARTTPDGAPYNYDDGYVFNDISGSSDGLTWYWGYDHSAAQVDAANHAIRFSRAAGSATLKAPRQDDDFAPGFELTYARELGRLDEAPYGLEVGLNWAGLDLSSRAHYRARGARVMDWYAFTPGTTPPDATPTSPFQGTFEGPGFVIANAPFASSNQVGEIGTVTGSRRLEVDLWGGRLGPNLTVPLDERLTVSLSGGLAVGYVDARVRWNETLALDSGVAVADAGRGSADDWRWGWYAAGTLHWQLSSRWSAFGGVQYQDLGKYRKSFGNRRIELDLSHSLFVGVGLGWSF